MNDASSLMAIWIAPLLLMWALLPSRWLNARTSAFGAVAEVQLWLALTAAAVALAFAATTGAASVTAPTALHLVGARLDMLSGTLLLLVAFLGVVIVRYSRNYLEGDARQGHFFKWLCFTLGAVVALVVAPGLVQFFLAWVATSLGLHKLLVYFPGRLGTLLSARKKFLVSRLGDLCLLTAFIGIWMAWGAQDFSGIFAALETAPASAATPLWIGLLLVCGAILKSAQFPFHTWLPDTMGAPTPVSALMHAGIINAGGYLIVRLSPILLETPVALHILALSGAVTAVFGAVVMISQSSIKRALAYSTIAQMGFMLLQCGLGAFHLAVLHIVAHSLYKAHAFLSSGSAVGTIKKLAVEQEAHPAPKFSLLAVLLTSVGVVAILSLVFGLRPAEKPGMLVLSTVLVMAVAQMLWTAILHRASKRRLALSLATATGVAAVYFALTFVIAAFLSPVVPSAAALAPALEWGLALGLFVLLLASLQLQEPRRKEPSPFMEAAYVHALNGFYLNTIANRVARTLGLVPADR